MKSFKHGKTLKKRTVKQHTSGSAALSTRPETKSDGFVIPFRWQKKTGKASSVVESFYHAFHGIKVGLKGQRNLRIHFIAAPMVVLLGCLLKIDVVGWLALVFAMTLVICAEFINTAIEYLVDISAEGQYRYAARCAKDTAASAVLVASFAAIVVGAVVFLPKLFALIS